MIGAGIIKETFNSRFEADLAFSYNVFFTLFNTSDINESLVGNNIPQL